MAAGRQDRYDPYRAWVVNGTMYQALIGADGNVVELLPKPVAQPREQKPAKRVVQHERIGRFHLVKHSGWYGLVRIDGTGSERWCRNKKEATEIARRITRTEAEAERRRANV